MLSAATKVEFAGFRNIQRKHDRVKRQQAAVLAGLKRASAEASIESVSKKAVKVAEADHPILHPPPQPKSKF